ncbi:THS7A protein, partial [Polypterus senegalus]
MGNECGPGGSQSRAVWCAHIEGWTTLHSNCLKNEKQPDNQQSCFRVCDWHKELYDWQLGEWNQCQAVALRNSGNYKSLECIKGEEGIQTREVSCVQKANGTPAEDVICEYFEPKPRLEQACLIPCPQDCVVSEFSSWSPCSKTCGVGLQHRFRSVLAPPLFGGSSCPNLTEFQPCQFSACESEESMYSLKVGPWSTCAMPHSRQARQAGKRRKNKGREKAVKDPETRELIKKKRNRNRQNRQESKFWDLQIGYQTRQVTCIHKNGKSTALK